MCNIQLYNAIGNALDNRSRGRGFESPLLLFLFPNMLQYKKWISE